MSIKIPLEYHSKLDEQQAFLAVVELLRYPDVFKINDARAFEGVVKSFNVPQKANAQIQQMRGTVRIFERFRASERRCSFLSDQGLGKRISIEWLQIVYAFADAHKAYGQVQLIVHCNDHAALSCAV